ncbi:MAG TPA: bifunctional folylpolyglutamate synthase/dihydrofolate synthase, partial [Candidatus Pelethocola excrementipullorum]|nr:bifunctional folylpolyglutamate synthase/dihydrofolate synthase [Candidatus Pelethocola excrementipullorum]
MNYEEARAYIDQRPRYGGALGLDDIRTLLFETGHPEKSLSFIHIAGTNGKGSVLSHISTVLTGAGYRIGRYISPTIYSYRERIQVNGCPISREDYTRLVEELKAGVNRMEASGLVKPSPFELETVLCFLYFKEQGCDYVVLECGLGGLTDATNVIPMENKKLAVLTSISLDHMEYLGDTLEKITLQKAGIIGPGVPVVSAPQKPESRTTLESYCSGLGVELKEVDLTLTEIKKNTLEEQVFSYHGQEITIHLAGVAQIENAVTAYEALQMLVRHGLKLTTEQIVEGMAKTRWNGRFTKIS